MKSKIFCFNRTIHRKNMALFWPIWVLYLAYMIVRFPFSLFVTFERNARVYMGTDAKEIQLRNLDALRDIFRMDIQVFGVFVLASIVAVCVFHYLTNSRSANAIHALPVTRGELYCTNVLSGGLMLLIPLLAGYLGAVIVCISYKIDCIAAIGTWFITIAGVSIFFLSIAVCAIMLSGQTFGGLLIYWIGNGLYIGIRNLFASLISFLGWGVTYSTVVSRIHLEFLSPIYYLVRLLKFEERFSYGENGTIDEVQYFISYGNSVIGYSFVSILFFALGYWFYKLRPLEKAGDFLTNSLLHPVFRWGAGTCAGVALSIAIANGAGNILTRKATENVAVASILIVGIGFFFVSDMLVQKTFRVVTKKRVLEATIFLVMFTIVVLAMKMTAYRMSAYLPELEKIEKIQIHMNNPVMYEGEDMEWAQSIHRELIENQSMYQEGRDFQKNQQSIQFRYYYKNGSYTTRSYEISINENTKELAKQINLAEWNGANYLKNAICEEYQEASIIGARLGVFEKNMTYDGELEISEEAGKALYEAYLKDIEAMTVQKYDSADYEGVVASERFLNSITFKYMLPVKEEGMQTPSNSVQEGMVSGSSEYQEIYVFEVHFGPDCENIIRTLLENEIIASTEELIL